MHRRRGNTKSLCALQLREDTLKRATLSSRADTYAAIKAMLGLLNDPFTRFLEPQQYAALR
jgi:carboxyl-terminal processing protease